MKKRFVNALLLGALVFGSAGIASCSYDDSELDTRVRVVETALGDLQKQMTAIYESGQVIKKVEKSGDGYVLIMGDDTKYEIKGGGTEVSVVENENSVEITVAGVKYVIPKGAAACQLIYSPSFADGIEVISGDPVNVRFQMSPAITSLDGAAIEVKEAHETPTRASSLFSYTGSGASISGDFITIPIMAVEAQSGKTYAANVKVTVSGKDYLSNYFFIKVGANEFKAEDLEDYGFSSLITDAVSEDGTLDDGTATHTWIATMPKDLIDDFSFADFFTGVPAGFTYEIAAQDKQVGNAAGDSYNVLKSSLASDGKWSLTGRLGCAYPDGFLVNIKDGLTTKMKVKFIFNDPLGSADFERRDVWLNLACHMEIFADDGTFWAAGANSYDIPAGFSAVADGDDSAMPMQHGDASNFLHNQWNKYAVTLAEEGDVIYHDGTRLVAGEVGAKYAKFSRGVYWFMQGCAILSSQRHNIPGVDTMSDDEKVATYGGICNGEIIYDWVSFEIGHDTYGFNITEDGKLITESYWKGVGGRIYAGAHYEYVYGDKQIGWDGLGFIFVNRRSAPEGAFDDYQKW